MDVVVLDHEGKPVPGLTRAAFVVEEDGRPQTVTAFEAVEALLPTLATDFIVPDFTEERLSTPILSDQLVSRPGEHRVLPLARRIFAASSVLHGWFELHGAAVDSETGEPRASASFVARSADGRQWAGGAPTAMSLESGKPTRLVSVPLAEAPEGENELVLTVSDQVSGRTFEVREPFRVEAVALTASVPLCWRADVRGFAWAGREPDSLARGPDGAE